MQKENENQSEQQQVTLEELESVAGGVTIDPGSRLDLSKIRIDRDSVFIPARPRLMNALPADLISLVESLSVRGRS